MSPTDRRSFLVAMSGIPLLAGGVIEARAQKPPNLRRIALSGHDPVAYFTLGQPEKGDAAFSFAFDDAVYHFKTAEHRAMFMADPEKYAPQYAGFCAAALARGLKIEPDPEAWAIVGGKLYVIALKERMAKFKQDPQSFINNADRAWPTLREDRAQNPAR